MMVPDGYSTMIRAAVIRIVFLLSAILLLALQTPLHAEGDVPARVMLVYPYSEHGEWSLQFESGFYDEILNEEEITINSFIEYIELGNINDEVKSEAMIRIERLNNRIKPDIIIALFPSVQEFILNYADELFRDKPKIFVPVLPSQTELFIQSPNTYIIETAFHEAMRLTIVDVENIFPDLEHLVVISGSSNDNLVYLSSMKEILENNNPQYGISYLVGLSLNELEAAVSDLPDKTAIMYLPVNRDNYNNIYFGDLLVPEISAAANAPVFSFLENLIGLGLTGGRTIDTKAYGKQAAETVLDIINSEAMPNKVYSGTVTPEYDWRQLQRWGIDEKKLPEGAEILYRPESFFGKYKKQIILITSFVTLETIMLILLIINLAGRKRTEQLLLDSEDLLQRSEETAKLGGWDFYPKTDRLFTTKEALNILGIKTTDSITPGYLRTLIHPDDLEFYDHEMDRVLKEGASITVDFRIGITDSIENWVEINCQAIRTNGTVTRVSGTIQNISEKKKYELEIKSSLRQKDILLQEVHHRVKNNLAIITSLLSMHSDCITNREAKRILLDSSKRVNTLAIIYEQIYINDNIETINITDYIKRLVGDLLMDTPKEINPVNIEYDIENRDININQIIPIGLIINETISNSLIHAFENIEQPKISISFRYLKEDNIYILQVKDNGNGINDIDNVTSGKTLGFLLINTLLKQINGKLEINSNNGLFIKITLSL